MPWKIIERIILAICHGIIYFLEGKDRAKELENKNTSSNVDLKPRTNDSSKDAEIEFLKKRADLLEELLKKELLERIEEKSRLETELNKENKKVSDLDDNKNKKEDNAPTDNKHPPDG